MLFDCFYLFLFIDEVIKKRLHIFWLFLIIRMVLRLLRGGSGDVRSDEDDDQAPTGADKSKKNKSRRQ